MAVDSDKTSLPSQPLRPRARILRTLGEELISNETVAIIELVKNAFDADATQVLLRFTDPLEDNDSETVPLAGIIEVIDNGNGMPLQVVQTAWMEPASNLKRRNRISDCFQRRVLGEKGIGRFASARLATQLELITRSRNEGVETYGIFDWTQFDDEDKYLDEVLILTEERVPEEITPGGTIDSLWENESLPPSSERKHGTILRMKGLKRAWTREHLVDLQRGLSRLVSPFGRKTTEGSYGSQDRKKGDPGFTIRLQLPERFSEFAEEIQPPELIKYPHYTVAGTVSADGTVALDVTIHAEGQTISVKGKLVRLTDAAHILRLLDENAPAPVGAIAPTCGPLTVELRVWDRDDLGNIIQSVGTSVTNVRRDLDAIAGVNIYRDGFRVLPYGEPQNDWLRLDIRRVQNPTLRLSNNQIAGYVAISSDQNPNLRDQSNREGLDDNQAFHDLRQIMHLILSRLEEPRYKARRDGSGDSKERKPSSLFASLDLSPLRQKLASALPNDKETQKLVDAVEQEFSGRIKQLQAVLSRYHRLATLGQLIDVLLHDGRHPIASIRSQALLGREDIQATDSTSSLHSQLLSRFEKIENQGNILFTVFKRVEPFGGRKRGRPAKLYLEKTIEEAIAVFSSDIQKLGIRISIPSTQTLVSVDDAEMKEVLTNLITNSLYWLEQVDKDNRQIAIEVTRGGPAHVEILFADSGPGIPLANRELIFEPYFSTKPEGVGLGLSIAGEIVSDYYDGNLELLDSGPLPGAVFRITLHKKV